MTDFQCDVVVVNYNAGEVLNTCVDSAMSAGASRVIVVDNASSDGSIKALDARFADQSRLTIVRNARNSGFAVACNIGAKESTAPFLLFLNPDAMLEPKSLARLMGIVSTSPSVGMAGGSLRNQDGSEQQGGRRRFPTPQNAFARAFGLSKLLKRVIGNTAGFELQAEDISSKAFPVEAISGACMLVRREAFDRVGGWDEEYFLHCEDLDLCYRFMLAGWNIFYVSDALVVHLKGECSRRRPAFVEWHKHKGMLRFYRKFYREKFSKLLYCLVVVGVSFRCTALLVRHGHRDLLTAFGFGRAS